MAIAVVKDGKLVMARGYGVREAGKPGRVDEDTLFAIASLTKGFTAATVGMLVDEGKLDWDDVVTRHLPSFAMADARVTSELTLRDLLAHRSGLDERADLLWFGTGYDRDELMRRLRHVPQAAGLRSTYSYQNVLYLAAGQAVARVAGKTWDDFVKERIFAPLGMRRSNTSIRALEGDENVARPHTIRGGSLRAIPYRNIDNIGPAASVNASVSDMARWLLLHLDRGEFEGKRLLSEKTEGEIFAPQMLMGLGAVGKRLYPASHFAAYGLGWVLQDYRGRLVAWNTGGMDGMSSSAALVPEEGLGVVVLSNLPYTGLPEGMIFRVIDAYLGAPEKDWSRVRLDLSLASRKRAREAQDKREGAREEDKKPSLPLDRYAGTYEQAMMGEAVIEMREGRLTLRLGASLRGDLEPWRGDAFRVTFADAELGTAMCRFSLDPKGAVTALELDDHGRFERPTKRAARAR